MKYHLEDTHCTICEIPLPSTAGNATTTSNATALGRTILASKSHAPTATSISATIYTFGSTSVAACK